MPAQLTIPTIFTAVDRFSSVVSKMGGSLDQFSNKAQRRWATIGRHAGNVASNAKSIAMSSAIGFAAVTAPMVYAGNAAVNFEKQMSNVSTLVDTNKESMSAMGSAVQRIFRTIPVTMEDLTKGLYQVRSAGIDAGRSMDVLKNSAWLSVTGLSTVEQSTNVLTSALNVFKDEGRSTMQVSASLFETVKRGKTTMAGLSEAFGATAPIVHAAGVSLNDFLSATAAITVTGAPAAQAMNEIRATTVALNKPTKDMAKIFAGMGISGQHPLNQLINKYGSLGAVLSVVEGKGSQMGINMAKAWGRVQASVAATLLTTTSKAGYQDNLAGMGNGLNDYLSAQAKQSATAAAHMQLLKNNAESLAITLGNKLLPVLNRLADKLIPVIDNFISWADKHPRLTSAIVDSGIALAGFLGTVSVVSTIVWGVASAVKAYAAVNLLFAGSADTAAASLESETVVVSGFGSAITAMGGEMATAEVAATSLLGVLSGLATVAAAGLAYNIYNDIQTVDQINKNRSTESRNKKWRSAHPGANWLAGDDKSNQFWNSYGKSHGWNNSTPPLFAQQTGFPGNVDPVTGKRIQPYVLPPVVGHNTKHEPVDVNITLHDPTGVVKDVKQSSSKGIQVHVTSTQGAR